MKNFKSKSAIIVCVVAVILIIALVVVGGKNRNNISNNNSSESEQMNNTSVTEEFVEKQENGGKVNTSEQLKKTKTVEGLEITNIRLVENGGLSEIVADAKNTTNSTITELTMIITAVDKNGNKLAELEASVFGIGAGQTTTLHAGITEDIANAYDFTVRKK